MIKVVLLLSAIMPTGFALAAVQADASGPSLAMAAERGSLRERMRQRRGAEARSPDASSEGRTVAPTQTILYGADARQRILFYAAPPPSPTERRRAPPLAIYIHGGGWQNGEPEMVSEKPQWYRQHQWAFASIGYRMLPDTPVEEQARDVGRAIARLREEAARLGFDADRILLTGHSAGAHLAALVAADPQYAGESFAAIRGVIPIDGACYDVPAQIEASPFMARRTYIPAFGTDVARQRALSPITHTGGPDAPDWLLLYTSARDDAQAQSIALRDALRNGGSTAESLVVPYAGRNSMAAHRQINIDFGKQGYAANAQVAAIMQRVAESR